MHHLVRRVWRNLREGYVHATLDTGSKVGIVYTHSDRKRDAQMPRFEKTVVMVNCVKLGRELPGLDRPPFPGDLGKRIFENVSKDAWEMWKRQSTLLVNHYGLNLADPNAQKFLMEQMEEFFFGEGAQMPEGWTPEVQAGKSTK